VLIGDPEWFSCVLMATVGVLHPGEMGAVVGAALVDCGHDVLWAEAGRSAESHERARRGGLRPVEDVAALVERCEIILSICPPHAALDAARNVQGFSGLFVDANAVAPGTSLRVRAIVGCDYVDGGIVGPPPTRPGTTRLYLSGARAGDVAELFTGARIEPRVLSCPDPAAASALKMVYAAWTKGSAALLLAIDRAARTQGVSSALAEEWALSQPQLADRLAAAEVSAAQKGWRWESEMREIAVTLLSAGQPGGFHEAAAEVYGRRPRA
jgi:3-hydroxyisobutyrate dehydrogenase-like beta-hydroxyacid dehydrogenase